MAALLCSSPDDHVFGFNEDGDYCCLICGEPIQNDCDLPYDYAIQAKIYNALERGKP